MVMGTVNIFDLVIAAGSFGKTGVGIMKVDVNMVMDRLISSIW